MEDKNKIVNAFLPYVSFEGSHFPFIHRAQKKKCGEIDWNLLIVDDAD